MPRLPALFPVLALVSACAGLEGPARPESLRLGAGTLSLRLSDGTLCETDWRRAPEGRLEGCGPGYGYAVRLEDSPNLMRQLAEGLLLALGAEDVLAPMAEVAITDPAGKEWLFVSPEPAGR